MPDEDDKIYHTSETAIGSGATNPSQAPTDEITNASMKTSGLPEFEQHTERSILVQSVSPISERAFVDRITKSDRWMIGLTAAIAAGGLISAVIFDYQLNEMRVASELTRESIRISNESLKSSRETLIAAQRPWISVDMTILGPLIFDQNGANIPIGVELKNHGHSPALNVRNFVVLDPVPGGRKGPDFCDQQRARTATNFAEIIFPDRTAFQSHVAHADANEIKNATQRHDWIAPLITACVDYVSTLDNVRHQTELTENLVKDPTAEDQSFAIRVSRGSVPKSNLHLEIMLGVQKTD